MQRKSALQKQHGGESVTEKGMFVLSIYAQLWLGKTTREGRLGPRLWTTRWLVDRISEVVGGWSMRGVTKGDRRVVGQGVEELCGCGEESGADRCHQNNYHRKVETTDLKA